MRHPNFKKLSQESDISIDIFTTALMNYLQVQKKPI